MKIQNLLAVFVLVAALGAPTCIVEAKQYKAGVAVSTVKKGGKSATKAQLNANPLYKEGGWILHEKELRRCYE